MSMIKILYMYEMHNEIYHYTQLTYTNKIRINNSCYWVTIVNDPCKGSLSLFPKHSFSFLSFLPAYFSFWVKVMYAAQASFELVILLLWPTKCWGYKYVLPSSQAPDNSTNGGKVDYLCTLLSSHFSITLTYVLEIWSAHLNIHMCLRSVINFEKCIIRLFCLFLYITWCVHTN